MEQWNREELYADVWEDPLTKLQEKYGISNVAIGKACRKLKVPLPGRGYWARKQAGQNVTRVPLPTAKDLPVVWRMKLPDLDAPPKPEPSPEPTDQEWLRIREMESRIIEVPERPRFHPIITETRKQLASARQNIRGILEPHGMEILDVRISKASVDRALRFLNEVIRTLEAEGFRLRPGRDYRQRVRADVFGQEISFGVAERSKVVARHEIRESPFRARTERGYEATGHLEFRVGAGTWTPEPVLADTASQKLESMVAQAVAAIMRKGRGQLIWEEKRRQEEIAERKRAEENANLAERIRAEEKKIKDFEGWVDAWSQAAKMREFVDALETVWRNGSDLPEGSERAQKLVWMRQQADRIDPLVFEKPRSVIDRKGELSPWEYRE